MIDIAIKKVKGTPYKFVLTGERIVGAFKYNMYYPKDMVMDLVNKYGGTYDRDGLNSDGGNQTTADSDSRVSVQSGG